MADIYYRNEEFNANSIFDKMAEISEDIEREREKSDAEYDRNKEFNLLYKQFMLGLKLNTGIRLF